MGDKEDGLHILFPKRLIGKPDCRNHICLKLIRPLSTERIIDIVYEAKLNFP